MKYQTSVLLADLYEQAEQTISKAIAEWQQLPADYLNAQPGEGSWSAAQCLEHLNSYGRYYLPAMEKAIAAKPGAAQPQFSSSWLGNYFYKLMLPDSKGMAPKKMKAPKDSRPAANLNSAKVLSEFISQQERVLQLITQAQTVDLQKVKVPISIAKFIRLSLGDTLLFNTAHIQRHVAQAERAILAAGYLPAPDRFTLA
ncbi:MAG: DinB family protein [Ferruginibacter sp.]|nr:DinB family protein [Ferruginibacter sp.]